MVRRRDDSPHWHYSFSIKGRGRFRGSTGTDDKEAAEIIEAKLKSDALLDQLTGRKPRLSLDDATAHYLVHVSGRASKRDIVRGIRTLLAGLGKATMLHQLTDAMVARFVAARRGTMTAARMGRDEKGKPVHKPLAESSINRELTLLRSILKHAAGPLGADVAPIAFKLHFLPEPEARSRYLTTAEAERLVNAAADHLRPAIRFALLTGLRLSNIIRLDWAQVDMRARQITFRVKSRKPGGKTHVLPITPDVLALLASLTPADDGPVFTYEGDAIGSWKRAWRTALRRAKISDFRFHDLRHTAASWMVQSGVPLDVVQDVLGHAEITTTRRYAHRETDAKARAMNAAAQFWHAGPGQSEKPLRQRRK